MLEIQKKIEYNNQFLILLATLIFVRPEKYDMY